MNDGVALPRGSTASASGIAPRPPRSRGDALGFRCAMPGRAWGSKRGAVMLSIWVRPELPVLDFSVRADRTRVNDSVSADGRRLMDLLR